jgi:hypothetical protein
LVPFGFNGTEFSVSSITARTYTVKGVGYLPRIPTSFQVNSRRGDTAFNVGSAADLIFSWHDSSNESGWGGGGYGRNAGGYGGYVSDVASLGYYVTVVGSGGVTVRSTYTGSAAFIYTNSMNAADNGAWRGNLAVSVLPVSPYGVAQMSRVMSLGVFF